MTDYCSKQTWNLWGEVWHSWCSMPESRHSPHLLRAFPCCQAWRSRRRCISRRTCQIQPWSRQFYLGDLKWEGKPEPDKVMPENTGPDAEVRILSWLPIQECLELYWILLELLWHKQSLDILGLASVVPSKPNVALQSERSREGTEEEKIHSI